MDFKNGARVGLFAFLFMNTFQTQANCYSGKKVCFLPRSSSVRSYLDMGFGKTINSNLPAASHKTQLSNIFFNNALFQQEKVLGNHLFLATGLLWFEPFIKNSPYFPYIDLGIEYNYTNDQKNLIQYEMEINRWRGGVFKASSPTAFTFSHQSLLMNLKLALYRWRCVMPYIYAGIGTTTQQTQEKIALFSKNIEAKFNDIMQHTFTYQLGIGVDFPITDHFWLSLSYQLQHMDGCFLKYQLVGSSKSSKEIIMALKKGLKKANLTVDNFFKPFHFNDLNTQTIQLTARYVFG